MLHTWEEIRRSSVIYEDDEVLALNKPAGITVVGSGDGTDLIALAQRAGEHLFPAHRIDKETSGAFLLAKSARSHAGIARQFNRHSIDKAYLAIVKSVGLPVQGIIDLPLSEGRKKLVRVAAQRADITLNETGDRWSIAPSALFADARQYPSTTTFARVWEGEERTLLIVKPLTGRRHQIRVHLAWIGHPIVGDPLFIKDAAERMLLHAWRIGFTRDWSDGKRIELVAEPGDDFWLTTFQGPPGEDLVHQLG
jgi:tRNA pseudouridine32 synthase/23S rRNA pseudouridine746 synthase